MKKFEITTDKDQMRLFKKEGDKLLAESFKARLALHDSLPKLSNECKIQMRDTFLKMREREDFIGAHFYDAPQVSSETIDFKAVPPPINSPHSYAPYHLNPKVKDFEFKTGDILITKGVSFISSTISEVVKKRALFSHMVFLYVDEATKEVFTMESYIGYGVKIFTIEEALKSENARILVLRPRDQELAKKAAKHMYDRIKKSELDEKPIQYDYALDFNESEKLSCEEIAYVAFSEVSNKKFIIPENRSTVLIKDEEFLKRIGIKAGDLMMPVDLETDSRFEIILDWTDYKLIRDSVRKDAVMGIMFKWMNEKNYKLKRSFRSVGASAVWATRYIPGVWSLMAKISGIPADFKKDVPSVAISTLESIKVTAEPMLEVLSIADNKFQRANQRWMTPAELRQTMDSYLRSHPLDIIDNFYE